MTYTILIAVVAGVTGQLDQTEDAGQREITLWRKAFDRQAKDYVITAVAEPANAFRLVERPVFLWNQPLRQQFTQIGSVYVWLGQDGRPGAIGTLYCWKMPDEHWSLSHEFHSLASTPLKTVFRGRAFWAPTKPGLTWRPVPDAPRPAGSRQRQLLQIRQLARQFQAHLVDRKRDRWELRLLSKPLYDYATEDGETPLAGALCAMCVGVDPELLLAIEARQTDEGAQWHYACGALAGLELHVRFQGKEVWSWPMTPPGGDPGRIYWRNRITAEAHLPADE